MNSYPPYVSSVGLPVSNGWAYAYDDDGTSSTHNGSDTSSHCSTPSLSQDSLISGICCACKTYAPRREWKAMGGSGDPCPPCSFCNHKFCRECHIFTYLAYIRCWSCGNERLFAECFFLTRRPVCLAVGCGYPVDSSWEVVWREDLRTGRHGDKYLQRKVLVEDMEEQERKRAAQNPGKNIMSGTRKCVEIQQENVEN